MARVIWKGQISFGLVEIQVGLYPATSADHVGFSLLDRRDLAPIGYKKVNKRTGVEVPAAELVRGFEVEEDQYVLLTDDDLESANVGATHTIDVLAFCDVAEIDIRYFDTPYYLVPTKRGSKAYALLCETLHRTRKVGIGKVVLRSKQSIAAITAIEGFLVLDLLRYATEIRDPRELAPPAPDLEALGVVESELKMAEMLVASLTRAFDPTVWRDQYRDELMSMIHRKAEGGTSAVAQPDDGPRSDGDVVDIMALLKKSIAAHKKPTSPRKKAASE